MASSDEQNEPLLKKVVKYYENCPGCKVEERKEKQKDRPLTELILLALVVLCNALPISSLFPFVYFMAYASEVCRDEHQALGLSVVGTMWGIGLIIGPALGGFLAQPADKYPTRFSQNSLFGRFPYLLPCLCISIIALVVLVTTFWLPETLHRHPIECEEKGDDDVEFGFGHHPIKEKDGQSIEKKKVHRKSLLKNWPVMSSIIVYCIYSLHEVAYSEIFSLWAESPKAYGGLGFTTTNVGTVLSITGVGVLIFQLLIFPSIANFTGPILITRIAAVLTIPVLVFYPFISMLSGVLLWLVINCASLLKNILSVTVYTGTFLLLNNSASQDQRGAANGLALTGMSLFKTFGPAGGGSVFAWAQKRQNASFLPGDQSVFFFLNVILVIVIAMTFEPFLPRSTNRRNESKKQRYSKVDQEELSIEQEQHSSS